jgi:hypothetical protein
VTPYITDFSTRPAYGHLMAIVAVPHRRPEAAVSNSEFPRTQTDQDLRVIKRQTLINNSPTAPVHCLVNPGNIQHYA